MGCVLGVKSIYGISNFRMDIASPVTSASILPALTNGARYVIDTFVISSKVSGDATLQEQTATGSSSIGPQMWFGAQGGAALDEAYIPLTRGSALTVTTVGSGSMSIFGRYHLEV